MTSLSSMRASAVMGPPSGSTFRSSLEANCAGAFAMAVCEYQRDEDRSPPLITMRFENVMMNAHAGGAAFGSTGLVPTVSGCVYISPLLVILASASVSVNVIVSTAELLYVGRSALVTR